MKVTSSRTCNSMDPPIFSVELHDVLIYALLMERSHLSGVYVRMFCRHYCRIILSAVLRAERHIWEDVSLVCDTCRCEDFFWAASKLNCSLPRWMCELLEAIQLCIHNKYFITAWKSRHDPRLPFLPKLPVMQLSSMHLISTVRDAHSSLRNTKANIMLEA